MGAYWTAFGDLALGPDLMGTSVCLFIIFLHVFVFGYVLD